MSDAVEHEEIDASETLEETLEDGLEDTPKKRRIWRWVFLLAFIALFALAVWLKAWQWFEPSQSVVEATYVRPVAFDTPEARTALVEASEFQLTKNSFDEAISTTQQGFRREVERINTRINGLEQRINDMQGVSSTTKQTLLLTEIEYFLDVANNRLLLAGDVGSAKAALVAAEERLAAVDDPVFYTTRESLREALAALERVGETDRRGVTLDLLTLSEQVSYLTMAGRVLSNFEAHAEDGAFDDSVSERYAEPTPWQIVKNALGKALSSVVRVEQQEASLPYSSQAEFLLKQNLSLHLNAARLSALQNDQEHYFQSLEQAKRLMTKHFEMTKLGANAMLEKINELQGASVAAPLPDISEPLRRMRRARAAVGL